MITVRISHVRGQGFYWEVLNNKYTWEASIYFSNPDNAKEDFCNVAKKLGLDPTTVLFTIEQ